MVARREASEGSREEDEGGKDGENTRRGNTRRVMATRRQDNEGEKGTEINERKKEREERKRMAVTRREGMEGREGRNEGRGERE